MRGSRLFLLSSSALSSAAITGRCGPQLFAYPLFLAVLMAFVEMAKPRTKISLGSRSALHLLWANLHGSFILFFILVGLGVCLWQRRTVKTFLGRFGVCLIATLINPRGFVLWQSVIGTFNSRHPSTLRVRMAAAAQPGLADEYLFCMADPACAARRICRRRKLSTFEWILFLAFSWLALTGIRYVIWDLFIISILTASLMPESDSATV